MRKSLHILVFVAAIVAVSAGIARADVCVTIDQAKDTFNDADRAAALILISRQFEAEGLHVATQQCDVTYQLSHVKLGDTITVTLSRPDGERHAMAIGMNDVPAVYSQLVRALLTGRDVGSLIKVVDRTNVTTTQAQPARVQSDSLFYTRLGYGGAASAKGGPVLGFGVRREMDAFAIDVSFFNMQTQSNRGDFSYGGGGMFGSFLKLEALRFRNKTANDSAYWGGGVSYGGVSASSGSKYTHGSGLQGELTAGYEMLRASNIRMFMQADVTLPFYSATSTIYNYSYNYNRPPTPPVMTKQYMPSAAISLGFGWGHNGKGRR